MKTITRLTPIGLVAAALGLGLVAAPACSPQAEDTSRKPAATPDKSDAGQAGDDHSGHDHQGHNHNHNDHEHGKHSGANGHGPALAPPGNEGEAFNGSRDADKGQSSDGVRGLKGIGRALFKGFAETGGEKESE